MKSLKSHIAIFDLDGALVDTDTANSAAYRAALRKAGVCDAVSSNGRITSGDIRRAAKWIRDIDVDAIVKEKSETYQRELWRSKLGVAAESLRQVLAKRNVLMKVVLLTDSAERRALETLRFHGIEGCFDEIVCNGGRGGKYSNYFRSHDTDPAECMVWENENRQIRAAVLAGVKMYNIRKVG